MNIILCVGKIAMPTFITLIEIGAEHQAKNLQNVRERYEEAVEIVESNGGEVKGTYFGDIAGYDVLTISEFPDRQSFDKADILYNMSEEVKADAVEVRPYDEFASLVDEALSEMG
ncbi:MAG: GYD domain-containing protein [Haloquadratum sp.]